MGKGQNKKKKRRIDPTKAARKAHKARAIHGHTEEASTLRLEIDKAFKAEQGPALAAHTNLDITLLGKYAIATGEAGAKPIPTRHVEPIKSGLRWLQEGQSGMD